MRSRARLCSGGMGCLETRKRVTERWQWLRLNDNLCALRSTLRVDETEHAL